MELQFWSVAKVMLFFIAILTSMAKDAAAASYLRNETDRLALLNFKLQISDDPEGVLKSWNHSNHHCNWEGITCNIRHQRVTSLTLPGKSLVGSISSFIGNLSFLNSIDFGENRFHGQIPKEIGRLFRLKILNLSINSLGGEIPVNLTQCLNLRFLTLAHNGLVGKIPVEFGSLKKLEAVIFSKNNLIKEIPSSFGNLSSLRGINLAFNNFEGSLPNEIGFLRNLQLLTLDGNKLSGVLPTFVYNMSTLSAISLALNFFQGKLPNDISFRLPNLQWLGVGGNQFHGNIPLSIVNATNLQVLDLSNNKLEGDVPTNLGNLSKLQRLKLGRNLLGRNDSEDLHFLTSLTNCSTLQVFGMENNHFGGQLPQNIGNLSLQVTILNFGGNKISGTIPESLMRLVNLYALSVEENYITGTILREFGKLQNLQLLLLGTNMLVGEIPTTLCNLTLIYQLSLQMNNLQGNLPACLGNIKSLKIFDISRNKLSGIISPAIFGNSFSPSNIDLSYNSFTGSLPPEVGKFANILSINISYNNFSGKIPAALGDCSNLQYLVMRGNSFDGIIPSRLASLKAIQYLDLSQNNLTGQIPNDLEMLQNLNYLNLSFNKLEGEVPRKGVFSNSSQILLDGNFRICGGILELQLPSCLIHRKKNSKLLVIIIPSSISTFVLISTIYLYCYRRRYQQRDFSTKSPGEDKFLRVSYHELQRATGGFAQENIVGSGSYGVVYKGNLGQQNGKLVAVKVLDLQKNGVSKSFKAECRALKNIRHRNLVSVISYCSSIDFKGLEFKALIYDFMENGSLDMWLHQKTTNGKRLRNLNLLQRMNIAIDVAYALQYLHHHCGTVIAHCDLKPSNILLDNDLTAHVGDFGLARLLSKTSSVTVSGTSSNAAIKGTIGYAAPEYAMGYDASTQGDVYSYGVLLLEIFTGKRPTDEAFINDMNLHNYVKNNLLDHVDGIFDPFLCQRQGEETRELESNDDNAITELENSIRSNANFPKMMNFIISIFEVGLKCSETSPNDRIDMNEVTRKLLAIRDAFLHGEILNSSM